MFLLDKTPLFSTIRINKNYTFNKLINMSIPADSITNCDTKKFFNRANLYFTITYTYIMITICKNLLFVTRREIPKFRIGNI